MMKRSIIILLLLPLLSACATFHRVKSNRWLAKAKVQKQHFYQEISFTLQHNFPVFEVALGKDNIPFNFMFDSGGFTVLSKRAIEQTNGIKKRSYIDVRDANKVTARVEVYELPRLMVGDVALEKVGFAQIGFTESALFSCMGIDGTLGPNILKEDVWHFDYDAQKIIWTDDLGKIPQLDQAIRVPISTNNIHKPWIPFTVGGVSKRAIVDTGANSLFAVPGVDTAIWQNQFPFVRTFGNQGQAGNSALSTNGAFIKMDTIAFAGLQLSPVIANVGQFLQDYILGNRIMEHYNLTFNLSENELYFHQRPGKKLKEEVTSFGCSFDFKNGQVVIGALYEGGPAMKAGIQSGDIVRKINGKSYSFANYCDFINNFEINQTSQLELEISRAGQKRVLQLEKKRLL